MTPRLPPDHETGMACGLCVDEREPDRRPSPDCPVCKGAGWVTVTQWRAAKIAGLFPKP